jgi:hypothetical protein
VMDGRQGHFARSSDLHGVHVFAFDATGPVQRRPAVRLGFVAYFNHDSLGLEMETQLEERIARNG